MEIILIRHGKPTSATNPKVGAVEYAKWIRRYNASKISINSRPEYINERYKSFYSLSSDLSRAIHSANIYTGKHPEEVDRLYREMEIPRYKLPLHLTAWHWVYLSRILWMFGYKGPFETFKQAKQRADLAAVKLIEIAQQKKQLVLFGHGYMNRYIRKSLINQGWVLTCKSNTYWGVTRIVNK
jgi:broad specificity phosphatase PhoE